MRQTRTRILSMLLALMMCLSLLPMTAMAATGEPTLFLDPNQDPNSNIFFTYADQRTSILSGTISGSTKRYTVRLFLGDNVTDTPIESRTCDKGTLTIDLSAHGRYGYELISISPDSTAYTVSPDKKLTLTLTTDTDIFIKSVLLDDNFTFTFNMNGAGEDRVYPVKYGDAFPTPPETPSLPGYRFLGWYSGRLADDHYLHSFANINAYDSKVVMDYTFYAMWEKEEAAAAVRVNFYPNGGRITEFKGKTVPAPNGGYPFTVDDVTGVDMSSGIGWTNTESSGLLTATALPSVEREGYTFDGWYFTGTGPEANQAYDGKLTDFSKLSIFDSSQKIGVLTELAAKWVESGETYTVKFDLNGASGTAPAPRKAEKGKTVVLPQLSAPSGYRFLGWGTSADGKAFTPWNATNPVNSDLTLYALWDFDRFHFYNSYDSFNPTRTGTYAITGEYLEALKKGLSPEQWGPVESRMNSKWKGSCFGMSVLYCLRYVERIDPEKFQANATVLYDFDEPIRNNEIFNLVNYYHLQQRRPESSGGCSEHEESARNNACYYYPELVASGAYSKCLVQDLTSYDTPSVVCFSYDGTLGRSAHAVVGLDCAKASDGSFSISVWDPNDNKKNDTLIISSDYKSASFLSGRYLNAEIYGSLPTADAASTFDHLNIQNYIGTGTKTSGEAMTSLDTTLSNFVLTAADGTYVEIKNGTVAGGSLKVAIGMDSAASDGDNSYSFGLPSSSSYTLTTRTDSAGTVNMSISNYYVALDSKGIKELKVTSDGQVSVSSDKAAEQALSVTSSQLGDTWNSLTATGTDTGFTVDVNKENVKIASENNVSVSIVGRNVFSDAKSRSQNITASASGTTVAVSSLGNGTQQPSEDNPFTDVKAGAYYFDAVLWAVEKKVTSGTSATTFSPDASCTRGQIVTFLWRAAGSPKPSSTHNPFTDVKSGTYYYDAVLWAVEKGITSGTSATTFSPDASCTRGQTVTFLWRAAGSPKAASSSNPFSDVKADTYYYDAVLWAVEKKVTSGTSATTFSPDATVTRGQTVTFLYRSQGK